MNTNGPIILRKEWFTPDNRVQMADHFDKLIHILLLRPTDYSIEHLQRRQSRLKLLHDLKQITTTTFEESENGFNMFMPHIEIDRGRLHSSDEIETVIRKSIDQRILKPPVHTHALLCFEQHLLYELNRIEINAS